jgi:hypothetical protein
MRKLLPMAAWILIAASAAHGQAAKPEPGPVPPGWKSLFNGKNLDGWAVADAGGKPAYTVEDGTIRTQARNGLLWYAREKIGNTTLRLVYRMANSPGSCGVLIRVPEAPGSEAFDVRKGMEVRIDDRGDDRHVTGVLNGLTKAINRAVKAEGEWNTLDITIEGPQTIVKLNGALVTDYDSGSGGPGYIALVHHDGQGVIWFREISVKE